MPEAEFAGTGAAGAAEEEQTRPAAPLIEPEFRVIPPDPPADDSPTVASPIQSAPIQNAPVPSASIPSASIPSGLTQNALAQNALTQSTPLQTPQLQMPTAQSTPAGDSAPARSLGERLLEAVRTDDSDLFTPQQTADAIAAQAGQAPAGQAEQPTFSWPEQPVHSEAGGGSGADPAAYPARVFSGSIFEPIEPPADMPSLFEPRTPATPMPSLFEPVRQHLSEPPAEHPSPRTAADRTAADRTAADYPSPYPASAPLASTTPADAGTPQFPADTAFRPPADAPFHTPADAPFHTPADAPFHTPADEASHLPADTDFRAPAGPVPYRTADLASTPPDDSHRRETPASPTSAPAVTAGSPSPLSAGPAAEAGSSLPRFAVSARQPGGPTIRTAADWPAAAAGPVTGTGPKAEPPPTAAAETHPTSASPVHEGVVLPAAKPRDAETSWGTPDSWAAADDAWSVTDDWTPTSPRLAGNTTQDRWTKPEPKDLQPKDPQPAKDTWSQPEPADDPRARDAWTTPEPAGFPEEPPVRDPWTRSESAAPAREPQVRDPWNTDEPAEADNRAQAAPGSEAEQKPEKRRRGLFRRRNQQGQPAAPEARDDEYVDWVSGLGDRSAE